MRVLSAIRHLLGTGTGILFAVEEPTRLAEQFSRVQDLGCDDGFSPYHFFLAEIDILMLEKYIEYVVMLKTFSSGRHSAYFRCSADPIRLGRFG